MRQSMRHLHCLHLLVLMLTIVACGLWCLDGLTAPAPIGAAPSEESPEVTYHAGSRRVLVVLLDSLPYRIATDPDHMPNLVALQSQSSWGRMETVFDAVTVPALRAAFTGQDWFSVFGFAKNIWHGEEGFNSLFTQIREAGLKTVVYSDGSFMQFGDDLPDRRETGFSVRDQVQSIRDAAALIGTGDPDLVIAHAIFTDRIAHIAGVDSDRYREDYRLADAVVAEVAAAVPDDVTLVIMGDHGHDAMGRHIPGMDVPTFALYRGPGFATDLDLGTIQIEDTRYLLSWALALPLPENYGAGRYDDALRPVGALPPTFVPAANDENGAGSDPRLEFTVVALALALIITIWINLIATAGRTWIRTLSAWLAIVLLFVSEGQLWGGWSATAVAGVGVGASLLNHPTISRRLLWGLVPALVMFALVPWGEQLSEMRAVLAWPRHAVIVMIWGATIVLAAAVSLRTGAMRAAWTLAAATGLLLYPTVVHHGSPATMAPLWLAMLVLVMFEDVRRAATSLDRPRPRFVITAFVAIVLLLLPFSLAYAENFQFKLWYVPIVRGIFWAREGAPLHFAAIALGMAARLAYFIPWRGSAVTMSLGAAAAVIIGIVQLKWTNLPPDQTPHIAYVVAIGLSLAAAIASRRLTGPRWRGITRVAWCFALWIIYLYCVRLDIRFYLWMDSLLAATFLSGHLLATEHNRIHRPSVYPFMLLLATMATTWVTMAWSLHRLEWGFLFDWFEVRFVERRVHLFLPLIVARYWIPIVIARLLLADTFRGWAYPARAIMLVVGIKTFGTLMLALGLGFRQTSENFLEAVQQTAIWMTIILAVPWSRQRDDEVSSSDE